MSVTDWGQKPCYKCGSKARVRRIPHDVLGEVYNICCTNPDCVRATSRNYAWRCSAVEAWNNKPTISDLLYDRFGEPLIERLYARYIKEDSKKECETE